VSVRYEIDVDHLLNFVNFQLVNPLAHRDRRIVNQYVNLAKFANNLLPCCLHISCFRHINLIEAKMRKCRASTLKDVTLKLIQVSVGTIQNNQVHLAIFEVFGKSTSYEFAKTMQAARNHYIGLRVLRECLDRLCYVASIPVIEREQRDNNQCCE